MKKILYQLLIILLLFFTLEIKALAQQTIFNVPSADLVDKGMIFFQHQSTFSGSFGQFDNNFVYGLGKHSEIDLTIYDVGTRSVNSPLIAFGFKSVFPLHKRSETKFTIGHLIPVSVLGHGVGGYSYSHLSTVLPKIKTRITTGIAIGTTTIFERDTVSFIAGIEQPITKKFGFAADWYSGKHSNGFFIPGFYYYVKPKTIISGGYRLRNNKTNGGNGFILEF